MSNFSPIALNLTGYESAIVAPAFVQLTGLIFMTMLYKSADTIQEWLPPRVPISDIIKFDELNAYMAIMGDLHLCEVVRLDILWSFRYPQGDDDSEEQ